MPSMNWICTLDFSLSSSPQGAPPLAACTRPALTKAAQALSAATAITMLTKRIALLRSILFLPGNLGAQCSKTEAGSGIEGSRTVGSLQTAGCGPQQLAGLPCRNSGFCSLLTVDSLTG